MNSKSVLVGSEDQLPLIAVTGSQVPYIYDLPHLLSLPKGFEFRFRYQPKWVDESLTKRIMDEGEAFAGRSMVILFHSQEGEYLIPVRRGEVIAIEWIAPMIFVRFRLGEFPKLNLAIESYSCSKKESFAPALDRLKLLAQAIVGDIDGSPKYDLKEALPKGYYIREGCVPLDDADWKKQVDSTAWARLVAILHVDPNLTGIPFFHVLGFQRDNGDSPKPTAIKNQFSRSREPIYGFSLKESGRYRLRVVEWSELLKKGKQPQVKVRCEHDSDCFALEGASDLVVGKYDVIEFTFSATHAGYSVIALRAEPDLSAEDAVPGDGTSESKLPNWASWPSVFVARIPVVVRPRPLKVVLPLLAGLAGLCLYLLIAPKIADGSVRALAELFGLGLIVVFAGGLNDFLGGIFDMKSSLKKLRGGAGSWNADDQ
jgi:hypothetical protein